MCENAGKIDRQCQRSKSIQLLGAGFTPKPPKRSYAREPRWGGGLLPQTTILLKISESASGQAVKGNFRIRCWLEAWVAEREGDKLSQEQIAFNEFDFLNKLIRGNLYMSAVCCTKNVPLTDSNRHYHPIASAENGTCHAMTT